MQREAEVRAGKAVGSGLSTTFTPMSDWITESNWITDRPPTEADGDKDGDVWVRICPDRLTGMHMHWSHVGIWTPWRHSHYWSPPAPKPELEPEPAARATETRRFVSISRTILKNGDHILDAIDDEGVAWWMRLDTQPHHPAFPPEDPAWQQLLPLPAREVSGVHGV